MSKSFYVYVHRKLTDNKPFYVGKGKGRRAYKAHGRSEYWRRISSKHGYSVEIIFDGLTEDEAFQCEIDTILEFKYFGHELCNLTSGGEGVSGLKISEEHKRKLSKVMLGKKKSKEAIQKTRLGTLGIKRTEQQNLNNSLAQMGNKNRADNSKYLFYSDNDIFIGTRREVEEYSKIGKLKINQLFKYSGSRYKQVQGWSVLTSTQLILLNFLISLEK